MVKPSQSRYFIKYPGIVFAIHWFAFTVRITQPLSLQCPYCKHSVCIVSPIQHNNSATQELLHNIFECSSSLHQCYKSSLPQTSSVKFAWRCEIQKLLIHDTYEVPISIYWFLTSTGTSSITFINENFLLIFFRPNVFLLILFFWVRCNLSVNILHPSNFILKW